MNRSFFNVTALSVVKWLGLDVWGSSCRDALTAKKLRWKSKDYGSIISPVSRPCWDFRPMNGQSIYVTLLTQRNEGDLSTEGENNKKVSPGWGVEMMGRLLHIRKIFRLKTFIESLRILTYQGYNSNEKWFTWNVQGISTKQQLTYRNEEGRCPFYSGTEKVIRRKRES